MKEDYLWDKSGNDPEIEKLENALAVFRYKETKPPMLPANNVLAFKSETKKLSRKIFSLPMTIAASVALMAFMAGLWFFVSNEQKQHGNNVALDIKQGEEFPQIPDAPKEEIKRDVKGGRVVLLPVAKKVRASKQDDEIRLTDEERYAYEQLMKALKITSDKLNYVKQKTQGEAEKADAGTD